MFFFQEIPGIFVVLNCCFHQNFPEFYAKNYIGTCFSHSHSTNPSQGSATCTAQVPDASGWHAVRAGLGHVLGIHGDGWRGLGSRTSIHQCLTLGVYL